MPKNINVILTLQDRFSKKMSEASYRTLVFKRNLAAAQLVSDKFAGVMHKMEAATAVGVTAATAFGKASLDEYKKFNSAMNEVAGIKGIDTMSDEFEKLVSAAKSAGDEVKGSTYIEAAESLKYLALAGYNTKQSITALPALLKAIKINGGEAATTADALTDSMSALGLTSDQANKYVDMAAAVQSASNTTMLQLQDSMIKYGSMFKNMYAEMGVSKGDMEVVKDAMALTGILASSGKKAEEAGTAINSLYSRWAKGTGEVQKGFDSIGMSIYDGNDELKSAYEIMTEIATRVKDLSPKERNAALAQIGGVRMAQSLQVMIDGFNRVGEDGQTAYEKITKAIEDSTGAADRYIDAVTSGYGGGVAMMEAEWSKLKVTAGEMIAPYVTDVLEKINENMPQIREWLKDEMPEILDGIYGGVKKITDVAIPAAEWLWEHKEGVGKGLLAAYIGMGAFRAGTGILTAADTGARLLNGINKQKAARAAIAAQAATATAATTGAAATATGTSAAAVTRVTAGEVLAPIGKIAGVAAILYMAYRNSEKLRESVRRFGESSEPIVTGFKKGLEKWEPVAERVKESVGAAFGAVGDTLSPAVDVLSNVNEKVSSGVGWVLENAPVAAQGLLDFADALLFGDNWESGMDTLVFKWEKLKEHIKDAKDRLGEYVSKDALLEQMKEITQNNADAVALLEQKWGGVNKVLDGVIEKTRQVMTGKVGEGVYDLTKGNYAGALSFGNVTWKERGRMIANGDVGEALYDILHPEQNALGTSYWKGGLTEVNEVNERGGEIIDLPRGSRIIPADKSEKMANRRGETVVNVNIENFYGSDESYVSGLADRVASRIAEVI